MRSLHLATVEDLPKLLPLVAAFHEHQGFDTTPTHQHDAILPLLEGLPHGAVWLIGPRRAPVGYVVVSFGWSVEYGGMDAIVDELYIRTAVRKRGMGSEAINALARALKDGGIRALHLEADQDNQTLVKFYERLKFETRNGYAYMSRIL
ncbi:GNAT family N-acetyltransferase [Marivita hallyeonensis]|uniref:Acetyltransferase (GNAT) family protein n=1 Tax=Marivita hallyeonensis TaxID=996342 RepID=A0A1M5VUE1_9RHOB|nr:GNAT family N-acetyltransferase [Marivita hallyeonensis]SHH78800.1 Acetyltransferase (GNAT) family protein [Marivita hallyeonensis]